MLTQFSSVQSLSHVQLFVTPWTAACQAYLSITNSRSLLTLMSIESVMPSNHLIPCRSLLLSSSILPSIRVFSSESALHIRWPKYWSFSFSINPANEHRGLISFRMDWLDLLQSKGLFKSLLQHHSSKASILWCSAFFMVQLSHPYTTTGKTIAFDCMLTQLRSNQVTTMETLQIMFRGPFDFSTFYLVGHIPRSKFAGPKCVNALKFLINIAKLPLTNAVAIYCPTLGQCPRLCATPSIKSLNQEL